MYTHKYIYTQTHPWTNYCAAAGYTASKVLIQTSRNPELITSIADPHITQSICFLIQQKRLKPLFFPNHSNYFWCPK